MSIISGYVLSILGIIILSILIDLILPNGKTSGFIKNIFGYLIIIVILSPIFTFFTKKDFNFDDVFKTDSTNIQTDFVASVNRQMLDRVAVQIEKDCYDLGIKNINVGVEADIFESKINIKAINVDLRNIVIDEKIQHTDIKTSIAEVIKNNIAVQKEIIVFYE